MIRSFLLIVGLLLSSAVVYSQELNCTVMVDAERAQTTDRMVFKDMEQSFARFMNERKWTSDFYSSEEKINCNMLITIESMPSVGFYNATVQIQASRPVYGTNYETILLNFADRDWQFNYIESTPLDFSDNIFTTNLTSMLAYYAYVILALDYDSFSDLGGEQHLQRARSVVDLAQQAERPGWQPFQSNRNRYWLVDNLMNVQLQPIRKGYYTYHRLGLDVFLDEPDEARMRMLQVIKDIQAANKLIPNSILKIAFFDAKGKELTDIFKEGNPAIKRDAYSVLVDVDPSNTERYSEIIGN